MSAAEAETLRKARSLIEDPKRWTQSGFYAVDEEGELVDPDEPTACAWCALGALWRFTDDVGTTKRLYEAADGAPKSRHVPNQVVSINDKGTHADVLALYDRAIELAEADQ